MWLVYYVIKNIKNIYKISTGFPYPTRLYPCCFQIKARLFSVKTNLGYDYDQKKNIYLYVSNVKIRRKLFKQRSVYKSASNGVAQLRDHSVRCCGQLPSFPRKRDMYTIGSSSRSTIWTYWQSGVRCASSRFGDGRALAMLFVFVHREKSLKSPIVIRRDTSHPWDSTAKLFHSLCIGGPVSIVPTHVTVYCTYVPNFSLFTDICLTCRFIDKTLPIANFRSLCRALCVTLFSYVILYQVLLMEKMYCALQRECIS